MVRLLAVTLTIDENFGIDKSGIDIGHGLEFQVVIRAVGNRQRRNHGLIVNRHAGDRAVKVGVARQIVRDIAEGVFVARQQPDFRLIADADRTDAASFGDINIHAGSRITQIQGNVGDGYTAVVAEAGVLILRMLADKAAGMLLVQNTGSAEAAIVNPEIGALVGEIGNRYNGRFRSNDLALGKGITNRVQLNTGIGMDIGIQIVRRSGSVDNRSVMTDNRDTADADAGIQLSIQIIHGVNIRAKAAALCITIAVNIQLVDGGINVDVSTLNHAVGIGDIHLGSQNNFCCVLHIRGHSQAGAVCGAIGIHAVLRGIAANRNGTKAVGDALEARNLNLCGIFQGQARFNIAQRYHTAGCDLRIGDNAVVLTNVAGDCEIAEVCGKLGSFFDGDNAAANQLIDCFQRAACKEAAAVCNRSCQHRGIGCSGDGEGTFCMNCSIDRNIVVGMNVVFALSDICGYGETDGSTLGIALRVRCFLRSNQHVSLRIQLGAAGDIGSGCIPALGREGGRINSNSGNFQALHNLGNRFACVVSSEDNIL